MIRISIASAAFEAIASNVGTRLDRVRVGGRREGRALYAGPASYSGVTVRIVDGLWTTAVDFRPVRFLVSRGAGAGKLDEIAKA